MFKLLVILSIIKMYTRNNIFKFFLYFALFVAKYFETKMTKLDGMLTYKYVVFAFP